MLASLLLFFFFFLFFFDCSGILSEKERDEENDDVIARVVFLKYLVEEVNSFGQSTTSSIHEE